MDKLGIEYFCFHDVDLAPEGNSLQERNDNLKEMVSAKVVADKAMEEEFSFVYDQ